jgi:hypothetical protein
VTGGSEKIGYKANESQLFEDYEEGKLGDFMKQDGT